MDVPMTDTEAMKWLQRYDKHLWGINASYVDAAKLMAPSGLRPKPKQIASLLFDTVPTAVQDEHGDIKASTRLEWRGVIRYWKCPDYASGPGGRQQIAARMARSGVAHRPSNGMHSNCS